MAKNSDSRENTIRAAAKLFRQRGYHGAGMQDILKASGSPRGSLYFHFPGGKEEIGVAALQFYAQAVRAMMASAAKASPNAEEFLALIVRNMATDVERWDFQEGCPIAAVALDIVGQSQALGNAVRDAFQSWELEIKNGLRHIGVNPDDSATIASATLAQLEGALLLARTYRSVEPLRAAERIVRLVARTAVYPS